MPRLEGKIAIITGGAAGIGLATAKRFVAEGASVMLVDIQEQQLVDAVAAIGEQHAAYCVADVTQADQVEAYVKQTIERFGRIDLLINNAGISQRSLFVDTEVSVYRTILPGEF